MMRRLGLGDFRVMPWKNGRGATTELLIHPPGASLASGFLWRLSMAGVDASGPFSSFPGVDRTLVLLSGDGLELDHGPHGRRRLACLQPAAFSGDWATEGRLLGGPCRDFNVMSARGRASHDLRILEGPGFPADLPREPWVAVYVQAGRAALDGEALEEGELGVLEPGESARLEGFAGARVFLVEFTISS
jgi:environmental stress-induced protein Ves